MDEKKYTEKELKQKLAKQKKEIIEELEKMKVRPEITYPHDVAHNNIVIRAIETIKEMK